MIHQIFAVTLKELKVIFRDREALVMLFVMPLFFIIVMSYALEGVFATGSKDRPIEILLVNEDRGSLAERVIADLQKMEGLLIVDSVNETPVTLKMAEELIRRKKFEIALHFKELFTDRLMKKPDDPTKTESALSLIIDPALHLPILSSIRWTIRGVVERHMFMVTLNQRLRNGLVRLKEHAIPGMSPLLKESEVTIHEFFSKEDLERTPRGLIGLQIMTMKDDKRERQPSATEQNVPAYTIFGVFFIILTLAHSFLDEKNNGTFQRLLASPLSRVALLIGKLLPYYLVNLIQIGLMFMIGFLLFDIHPGHMPALIIVSLALSATANGMGLLIAALGRTEAQVNALSILLAITLAALGGMMVPAFVMPDFLRTLSHFTPHAWALAGFHDVIIRGSGVKDILAEVGVLLGFASFFFLFALWRFRFD